ncbi:uncharacterized protein LOC143918055 [Arctopsyche grandis]|uniref:uncharacterized protein LOC143918055 n=1 Tax=Arctopsyche grandis TaxID=121162 RepID=UPI00406D784B
MMKFIVNRLKALILVLLGAIRRALCCFRSRRRSYTNDTDDCLTDVGIVPNRNDEDLSPWDNKWSNDPINRPQTIEDHIQMYREKIQQTNIPEKDKQEEELNNLFQEMAPQNITQKRILIDSGNRSRSNNSDMSRLAVSTEGMAQGDLGEWLEESGSGWDEQHVDPFDVLREQRRLKRENRQQNAALGRKLKA